MLPQGALEYIFFRIYFIYLLLSECLQILGLEKHHKMADIRLLVLDFGIFASTINNKYIMRDYFPYESSPKGFHPSEQTSKNTPST